jgi:hypothetical protein
MKPSLEAVNVAVRLNSDLLPPIGSTIVWFRKVWAKGSEGWEETNMRPWVVCEHKIVRGFRRAVIRGAHRQGRLFLDEREGYEFLKLPDNCPPISQWYEATMFGSYQRRPMPWER